MAVAMAWTSRVTTIALEMVVPGLVGLWIDHCLGTKVLFLVLGLILGFGIALRELVKLANPNGEGQPPPEPGNDRRKSD